jgi:quinoprotein glucose dehydrogenase
LIFGLLVLVSCKNVKDETPVSRQAGADYPAYGGNKENNRYSPLTQINLDNVKDLQVAWTYFANDIASIYRTKINSTTNVVWLLFPSL